jgi:superfamily II DNA or RNA helicase
VSDLSAELESLKRENARLRRLLELTEAEAAPAQGAQTAWFDKAPGPVDVRSPPQAKVEFYEDEARNGQILTDVVEALGRGRHCLVLAQRTSHVDHLAATLVERGLDPVVLKGGMGAKQGEAAVGRLNLSKSGSPLLGVATGHFVGEGFDCPALDTLFLAGPVSFKGRLVQYAGRVLRAHPGKQTAEVHDYHDVGTPVLAAALNKRAPGYIGLRFPDPRKSS